MLTLFLQATPIDATIGMMIGAGSDAMIVGITIAVGLEAVEVTGGIDLRGCLNYHLRSNQTLLATYTHTAT
jgi:hypothetical protein